jgi:pimeloyl-ACP methyl ester carboxylesterase
MGQPVIETVGVRGLNIEVVRHGSGPSLMFLHPHLGLWKSHPFIDALSESFSVCAPSHPGFGASAVSANITSVDDLSYFYLDLLEQWDARDVLLVGASLGGWIALAIAIKDCSRLANIVLIDSAGVHFGMPLDEDIADIFSMSEQEFASRAFSDAGVGKREFGTMTDAELLLSARNREAAARYGWMPCLYDPRLKQNLHRVHSNALVLWGENDRIASVDYGRQLSNALPQAVFESIPAAGHFPHIEKPRETAQRIITFAANAKRHAPSRHGHLMTSASE